MKTTSTILAVLTTAAVLAGCSALSVNPVTQFLDDASTTATIKRQLAADAGLGSLTAVGVRTSDDMVWLTGTVHDSAERHRIETIARRIAGDNRVISELRVADTTADAPATAQK